MKHFGFILIAVVLSFPLFAQKKVLHSIEELAATYANLNKQRDTVIVNGIYYASGKINTQDAIDKLHNKQLINKRDYQTAISFSLFDAPTKYYLPYWDKIANGKLIDENSIGKKISLEIILFKSLKFYKGRYFFLIRKVIFLDA